MAEHTRPSSPVRSPRMAAHESKSSLSSAGRDRKHGGSKNDAHSHSRAHHGHHEVPHANLILWTTMIATLTFFFIYFFLTIPLKAPDYPSSSGAGSGSAAGSNSSSGSRLLDASETM